MLITDVCVRQSDTPPTLHACDEVNERSAQHNVLNSVRKKESQPGNKHGSFACVGLFFGFTHFAGGSAAPWCGFLGVDLGCDWKQRIPQRGRSVTGAQGSRGSGTCDVPFVEIKDHEASGPVRKVGPKADLMGLFELAEGSEQTSRDMVKEIFKAGLW